MVPNNVEKVRKVVGPDLAGHDSETWIKFLGKQIVRAITDSLFLTPEDHVLQAAVSFIEPAANVDADQFYVFE